MSKKNRLEEKKDFSLVVKLNSRLLWHLFTYFIVIDVVLFFLICGFLLFGAEKDFAGIYKKYSTTEISNSKSYDILEEYHIKETTLPNNKIKIYKKLVPYSDMVLPTASRYLTWDKKAVSVFDKTVSMTYGIYEEKENGKYQVITYDIGDDFRVLAMVFAVLLVFEGIIIIGAIGTGAKTIRSSLKPIYEIEVATRNMQNTASVSELSALAGRINRIEAQNLNSRIPVDTAQEELKGLSAAINDLLERIEEAYRSQSRFVSDASHELRTPISVIQGYANLLDRWGKNDEKTMEESIKAIKNEADNMKDLVEQLLFLARGDNETMVIQKEKVNISLLAEEVYKESQMIDKNHEIGFFCEKQLFVDADVQLIKQALRILVDNSIKYTPPKEKISLQIKEEQGNVSLIVQDNGIGMAEDDLPYIFDRFYRSDDSRARKTGGTGLGLSIAKWIIHRHNGHMEVLSRKDFGTRITVVLPKSISQENEIKK